MIAYTHGWKTSIIIFVWLISLFFGRFGALATYIILKISGIEEIGARVFSLLYYVLKAFTSPDPRRIQSHVRVVFCIRPNFGLVILNVDDNMFFESILDGFSRLICDHTWYFLHGFLGNINRPSILHVEILGLKLCWDFGNKKVFVSQT